MRGLIHHIDLTVRDPVASFPLYDAVLGALGYRLDDQNERGFEWVHTASSPLSVSIVRATDEGEGRTHNRYSPGLHHIAWAADTPEAVDQIHAVLLEAGAAILDPPTEYPQYNRGRGYYAVFFADIDGLKLEVAYTTP